MKTILYLSYLGGLGGGERILLAHLSALDRTQFSPRVICATDGSFAQALGARNIPSDIMPFALPYFKSGVLPVLSPRFFPRLHSYLHAHRIDLIHCNDPESTYYAAPLARLGGMPIIWTAAGWWQAERGWKSAFYERMLSRILSPTQYIKTCLVETNSRLKEKITVLPFGVDTDEFSPGVRDDALLQGFGIPCDAPIVTVLARFQAVKGHANFLDAAPQILDAVPATRFLFVGDTAFGTDDANETRRTIRERVAGDERLRTAVIFAGFQGDIPRILRSTDVLACPSDFESYGMSNLEAMACAIPVVSTNVGGPAETIVDGETGFLIPPRDPDALAAHIIRLLKSPDMGHRMGDKGRARVIESFALSKTVVCLQRIYSSLL